MSNSRSDDEENIDSDAELCSDGFDYDSVDSYVNDSVVVGYYENEYCPVVNFDRSGYTNIEIENHLEVYFRLFGRRDIDVIYLYFLSEKRQIDIRDILGKTQPAISYDVSRIRSQMDFVIRVVSMLDDFVIGVIGCGSLTTFEKELLTVFFYSTSWVKTARILSIEQHDCRSLVIKLVAKLMEIGCIDLHDMVVFVMDNLNKIKKAV